MLNILTRQGPGFVKRGITTNDKYVSLRISCDSIDILITCGNSTNDMQTFQNQPQSTDIFFEINYVIPVFAKRPSGTGLHKTLQVNHYTLLLKHHQFMEISVQYQILWSFNPIIYNNKYLLLI